MFFLNLNLPEFLALLGTLGGVITALYLLDRGKRRKIVSTLRFWTPGFTAAEQRSRKRMREPWSLILQLVSLLLLLLAVAQLEWGSHPRSGRDHVLLLDVSAWSAAKSNTGTALEEEKRLASAYVSALRSQDRVMILQAGALIEPVTSFTANRASLYDAINRSQSGFSALNVDAALSFARQAQSWSGGQGGEVVYLGPARAGDIQANPGQSLPNLRFLSVPVEPQNCGIRGLGVRRSDDDADGWQATVSLRNYNSEPRTVVLKTRFAGTAFATRTLVLNPQAEAQAEYSFSTSVPGQLVAEIDGADSLAQDNRAVIVLPRNAPLKVLAYTNRPDILRPLFEANRRLSVSFAEPAAYNAAAHADIFVLDGFAPRTLPQSPSLLVNVPKTGSPIPVKTVVHDASVNGWGTEDFLGAGLRARDLRIADAKIFQVFSGDLPVAITPDGPVVVARPTDSSRQKLAVIGFDPLSGALRFQVTTPLLFASLIRWLAPESFHVTEISAGHVGQAAVPLDRGERAANAVRVTDEAGYSVPFTVHHDSLQLFSSRPAIVRITSGERERVLSLTLPDVGETIWNPGTQVASGIPAPVRGLPGPTDLWKWLAVLGGLGLLIEYYLYGSRRAFAFRRKRAVNQPSPAAREFAAR